MEQVVMAEARMQALWGRGGLCGRLLTTADGRAFRVLNPGAPGDGRGPDFLGATIVWHGGGLTHGDVELHVRSEDWHQHGHDHDPRYDGVVLHVVLRDNPGYIARLATGASVPAVSLENHLDSAMLCPQPFGTEPRIDLRPCYALSERQGARTLSRRLTWLGKRRFYMKCEAALQAIKRDGYSEALYAWTMGALGYARNKEPFFTLSRHVHLSDLQSLTDRAERQALLLGRAGLLPSQRVPALEAQVWVMELETAWRTLGLSPAMNERDWDLFHVRPANFPMRRLAAMESLARPPRQFDRWVLNLVREAPVDNAAGQLEPAVLVPADGYWADHADFGVEIENPTALLGRARAREMVINVFLPFTVSWAGLQHNRQLQRHALGMYSSYPPLAENRITARLGRYIWNGEAPVLSACQQQGLQYLNALFCQSERCGSCPIVR
ncbi:MAG: DUF2851 family protein [Chloroflexi bacterium]|nr:DUF2851 family protein [Chloroflexota bacterium]